AQKTDAKMMAQALLLSEQAQFASKPELEIFADDVQCGHGATSGRIDETQLFYLLARGVPRAEAEQLLIEAFLDDAIDTLKDETIAASLKGVVSAWLRKRGSL
ncbi:MAG TPA: SufD family Fe-S cluster assembly protein, partial [Rudaea sp.]|nr:SufD family Fe-S cluster assembly protein [Rudaea sp.]